MKNFLLKLACITLIFISIRSVAANVSLVVLGDSQAQVMVSFATTNLGSRIAKPLAAGVPEH